MAYIDQGTGRHQRATAMIAVGLIQGAAIVALINGFTVKFFERPPPERIEGEQIPITPIPAEVPPPPEPPPVTQERPLDAPLPPLALPRVEGPVVVDLPPIPPMVQPSGPVVEPPVTPQTPAVSPRAAMPRNAPGGWATPNDYPARDLREGNQGVTRFSLAIGADGSVQGCTVIASSGFAGLDKATCDNVSRRARFEPATDGNGNRVAGTYRGSIRWQIPRD